MIIPSIVVSALFAYAPGFTSYTLDAVLVIAVTYLGTVVAAAILPWRRKDIYDQSPIARYSIAGIPALTIASVITGAFLVFNLYEWVKDSTYGVNNPQSFILMGSMYVLAIAIYIAARIIRSRQGIDLRKIHEAIPVE
jgi:amino acid transporter